jgi:hypothetical protein
MSIDSPNTVRCPSQTGNLMSVYMHVNVDMSANAGSEQRAFQPSIHVCKDGSTFDILLTDVLGINILAQPRYRSHRSHRGYSVEPHDNAGCRGFAWMTCCCHLSATRSCLWGCSLRIVMFNRVRCLEQSAGSLGKFNLHPSRTRLAQQFTYQTFNPSLPQPYV